MHTYTCIRMYVYILSFILVVEIVRESRRNLESLPSSIRYGFKQVTYIHNVHTYICNLHRRKAR